MKNKHLWCTAALFIFIASSFAQNQLSGIITNSITGKAIAGVSVYFPDLKNGTITNSNGHYVINNLPKGNFLMQISSVGYASNNNYIKISGNKEINFALRQSNTAMQEILVTGFPYATELRKNPLPGTVLTQKDLLQYNSSNIIDAIQSAPGVSQITEGPAISKPVIRGLGYSRVLLMNDGVRQEGQQWGDEFGIEVDEYSVNRVEILRGPSSLNYGSDAMAGVINFIAPAAPPEGKTIGNIIGNYQTNNGLYATSLNLAGNQNNFIYDLRYTFKTAHDYKNKYDGYVWNSGYQENDLKGIFGINRKWGYSHLVLSTFSLKLGIIEGARDSATGKFTTHFLNNDTDSLGIAPDNGFKRYNYFPIIHQHVRHYKAVLDNNFIVGGGNISVKLGVQQNFRQEANDITKGDIYNNYFYLRTINYDAQYILKQKNRLALSFGVNGMSQSSEDRGIVFLVPEYNSFDLGFFSTARKSIGKLTLSGGVRFDSRILHGKDLYIDSNRVRLKTLAPGSINRFTAYKSDFSGFSGSIGATYDFSDKVYGKLNFSRGFRAPNIAESGSDGIHDGTPFYEIGDPNLKPENSLQTDLTFGVNNENISFEINGFVNKINNYIFPVKLQSVSGGDSIREDFAAGFGGPTFKYIAGDAVLSGGELSLIIHPEKLKWLSFENSFSLLHAIQLNQGDSTKYLPYSPPQKYVSALKFSCGKMGKVFSNSFLKLEYQHYFKQDKIYYKFGNETTTPGYTLINASIGTDINISGKLLCSLYILGNNLADVAYQSNMSRVKYADTNNVTGRVGVYNMGRNISLKLIVPLNL